MSSPRKSDELIATSLCIRQALDEHVDALAAVVYELREVAQLDPRPDLEGDTDA